MEKATFGAGCFWCVEDEFRRTPGVVSTAVGYSGGKTKDPDYEQVCSGATGHAEVVQVDFDPAKVSYPELLEVFWAVHNPTTIDRQGPDVGSQYRSVIFYHTPQQEREARSAKEALQQSGRFPDPVVTGIVPAGEFYRAEEYHQQYMEKQRQTS